MWPLGSVPAPSLLGSPVPKPRLSPPSCPRSSLTPRLPCRWLPRSQTRRAWCWGERRQGAGGRGLPGWGAPWGRGVSAWAAAGTHPMNYTASPFVSLTCGMGLGTLLFTWREAPFPVPFFFQSVCCEWC